MKKEKTTIHDIAQRLNITASTVSRALSDHPRISEATKIAVHQTAQKLNYQPNNIAGSTHIDNPQLSSFKKTVGFQRVNSFERYLTFKW